MNIKKISLGVVISILLVCMTIAPTIVKAATLTPPIYFGITELRTNSTPNMGYAIGEPQANGGNGISAKIWNIVKLSGENSNDPTEINAYCLKAGIGFTDIKKQAAYDVSYDMRTDRETMKSQNDILNGLATGLSITKDSKTVNSYDALLALADLLYLYGETTNVEKTALLEAAGIHAEAWDAEAALSEDEIEAIQQAAIWYFTNYDEMVNNERKYDKYDDV